MELSGKALKDFWIWYLLPKQQKEYKTKSLIKFGDENVAKVRFLAMSFTERFGVFGDFFETKGIYINISNDFYQNGVNHLWQVFVYDNTQPDFLSNLSTGGYGDNGDYDKDTSRIKSVEAANEIYNKLNI